MSGRRKSIKNLSLEVRPLIDVHVHSRTNALILKRKTLLNDVYAKNLGFEPESLISYM